MWLYRSMLIDYAPVSKLFVYQLRHSGKDRRVHGTARSDATGAILN
jgi:hypothetical protein